MQSVQEALREAVNILEPKYAIVNADRTAFVYYDLGMPSESKILKKSGISDTQRGVIEIIRRMRAGCFRHAQKSRASLETLEEDYPGPEYAALRKSYEDSSKAHIKRMEELEEATYRVVKLSFIELP